MRKAMGVAVTVFAVLALTVISGRTGVAQDRPGTVTIDYTYTSIPGPASNQWVIWIENSAGGLVKTLFLPNYSGRRGGLAARPNMLVVWREKAGADEMSGDALDAISQATPSSGGQSVTWDLTDTGGNRVAPGTYTYNIEASLLWANTEMWTGTIAVGGDAATSKPGRSYFPAGADTLGRSLITNVTATYTPAP